MDIKLAVVGDVHDQWGDADTLALHHLFKEQGVEMVLFVGDVGNENIPLISQIADIDLPKAVILGNHDAW